MGQQTNSSRKSSVSPPKRITSNMNSTDALDMVSHGSELYFSVTTPVGTTFNGTTKFIGSHTDNYIFIEVPDISKENFEFFLQEGFWLNLRAISHRGEGAIVRFRSQIRFVLDAPVPMIMISVPNVMQVSQLRKEPRFELNLPATALVKKAKLDCELRDLSKSGCRFVMPPLSKMLTVGDKISLHVSVPSQSNQSNQYLAPLVGEICNFQASHHYNRYGVKFDEFGLENAKKLLARLKFDGTKLSLKR